MLKVFSPTQSAVFPHKCPKLLLGGPTITFHRIGPAVLVILLFQADLCCSEYWHEFLKAVPTGGDLVILFSFPSSSSLSFACRVIRK